jgi:hypothetical protein
MPIRSQPTEPEKGTPYLPNAVPPLVMEAFQGINTYTTRPGVDDKQCWWIDGFMPINERFLRTLYGPSSPITFPNQISFFDFANIGSTPYCIVIHSDGSIDAINTVTSVITHIAPAGTILNPAQTSTAITQYGSKYVLIVTTQPNGYFIWDGTVFHPSGGIGPIVTLTNVGSGYTSPPTVTYTGAPGTGATFTATIANGIVTAIIVTNAGSGYPFVTISPANSLTISGGGGTGAAGTISVVPTAISGTDIETYQGRVWIINGATLTFSAPGSVTDFTSGDGGGSITSTDSFLRVSYIALVQTNGFLYLIADSSVSYISGVQTSGTPPVTVFTLLNADPEVGSPWKTTVTTFGRSVIFANAFGAHINYGAAVTKVSDPLNGIYNTVPNFAGITPSAAKSILFGVKVWMLLLPIVDPFTVQQVNKLLMWDGKKWWASGQGVNLIYIQHQEINSVLTAWGTDGFNLYQLFQQPTASFTKVVQSKLWDKPIGYQMVKTAGRLYGITQPFSFNNLTINVSIDNEVGPSTIPITLSPSLVVVVNASGTVIPTMNASGALVEVLGSTTTFAIIHSTAVGQQGILLGMTVTTQAQDMAIISLMFQPEIGTGPG